MSCDRLPGNREALDAISALTGRSRSDITDEFHSECSGGDRTRADPADVEQVLRSLINRVRNAPALPWDRKAGLQDTLTAMLTDPTDRSNAQVDAWRHLVRHHPQEIGTLERPPVALPVMDEPQEAAWHALMDFDRDLDESWVLVGGQMTMIHCLEHGVDGYRATDDGDIVLGVWTGPLRPVDGRPAPTRPRLRRRRHLRRLRLPLRPRDDRHGPAPARRARTAAQPAESPRRQTRTARRGREPGPHPRRAPARPSGRQDRPRPAPQPARRARLKERRARRRQPRPGTAP